VREEKKRRLGKRGRRLREMMALLLRLTLPSFPHQAREEGKRREGRKEKKKKFPRGKKGRGRGKIKRSLCWSVSNPHFTDEGSGKGKNKKEKKKKRREGSHKGGGKKKKKRREDEKDRYHLLYP